MGTMASKYGRGSGDISSFYGAAQRISCRNRPFYDLPMWVNGKTADLAGGNKSRRDAPGRSVLGGMQSGWGQFGAVKKWAVVIGGLRRQLNAL